MAHYSPIWFFIFLSPKFFSLISIAFGDWHCISQGRQDGMPNLVQSKAPIFKLIWKKFEKSPLSYSAVPI